MIIGDLGSVIVSQIFHVAVKFHRKSLLDCVYLCFSVQNSLLLRAVVMIIVTCVIAFPLSLSKRFDHLTSISIQSIIFYLLFCVYVRFWLAKISFFLFFDQDVQTIAQFWLNPTSTSIDFSQLVYWRWSGLFVSLPIVSLSFSCQTYE